MPFCVCGGGPHGCMRALEMLLVTMYNGYFLASRDITRQSSSFCNKWSSTMRRLHLGACENTRLSLNLSEWLEWKCRSAAQSVGLLDNVMKIFQLALIWIVVSRKDIFWVECWKVNKDICLVECWKVNLIAAWRWFMKSCRDWGWLALPRKIRKVSSVNPFQKRITQMKASQMVSSMRPMKRFAYGGATLVPAAVRTSWRKC